MTIDLTKNEIENLVFRPLKDKSLNDLCQKVNSFVGPPFLVKEFRRERKRIFKPSLPAVYGIYRAKDFLNIEILKTELKEDKIETSNFDKVLYKGCPLFSKEPVLDFLTKQFELRMDGFFLY